MNTTHNESTRPEFEVGTYTEDFLEYSWKWLNDPEIKELTQTPDFTREDQRNWYNSLSSKQSYYIRGVKCDGIPVAAYGIKNISATEGEYWAYIGDRRYWKAGLGTQMINLAIKHAKEIGLSKLYLHVTIDNIPSINVHFRSGFKLVSRNDQMYRMEMNLI